MARDISFSVIFFTHIRPLTGSIVEYKPNVQISKAITTNTYYAFSLFCFTLDADIMWLHVWPIALPGF